MLRIRLNYGVVFGIVSVVMVRSNRLRHGLQVLSLVLLYAHTGCDGTRTHVARDPVDKKISSELQKQGDGRDEHDAAKREMSESPERAEVTNGSEVSVDELASRNSPPQKSDVRDKVLVSSDFDLTEEKRVRDVWENLLRSSDDCFSDIVAHMDDDRYCVTYRRLSVFRVRSVGDICISIMSKRLETLIVDDDQRVISAFQWIDNTRDGRRAWMLAHAKKSLVEMQLEGLQEMEKTFTTSPQYSSEKSHYLERIQAVRKTITSTKKPIPFHGAAFSINEDSYDAIRFLLTRELIRQDGGKGAVE